MGIMATAGYKKPAKGRFHVGNNLFELKGLKKFLN